MANSVVRGVLVLVPGSDGVLKAVFATRDGKFYEIGGIKEITDTTILTTLRSGVKFNPGPRHRAYEKPPTK